MSINLKKYIVVLVVLAFFVVSVPTANAQVNLIMGVWRRVGDVITSSPLTQNLGMATTTQWGFSGLLDKLFVHGRTNSTWRNLECTANGQLANITGDTSRLCSGDFVAVEDNAGLMTASSTYPSGNSYFRISTGDGGFSAAGDGMGISFANHFLMTASNTPVIEVVARMASTSNSTSTSFTVIGFATTTGSAPNYAAQPDGCTFTASSSQTNWWAVCKNGSNISSVSTGIASSTVVGGAGAFRRFRLELDDETATFYIQSPGGSMAQVALITGMSVASQTPMVPLVAVGKDHVGLTHELQVQNLKVWFQELLW